MHTRSTCLQYNIQNTTHWPSGKVISNSNLLGGQFYRWSDDAGVTWSQRYRIPIRNTTIDFNNAFSGAIPMGWSVGKPFLSASRSTAFLQYTKIGCPPSAAGKCEYVVSYDEVCYRACTDVCHPNLRSHTTCVICLCNSSYVPYPQIHTQTRTQALAHIRV